MISQVNQYRTYVIFGDTVGGVERKWARESYRSAVEVWSMVHSVSVDVLESSWHFNEPEIVVNHQRRAHALRILACALEAQGDTSHMEPPAMAVAPTRALVVVLTLNFDFGTVTTFWAPMFREYWKEFPWRLAVHIDPHGAMIIDTEPLCDRDLDARTVVQLQTQSRIRAWFNKKRILRARAAARVAPPSYPKFRTRSVVYCLSVCSIKYIVTHFLISVVRNEKSKEFSQLSQAPADMADQPFSASTNPTHRTFPIMSGRGFEIIRPGSWWKDFHEQKRRRKEQASAQRLELAPGQQQSPIYTFVPGRDAPLVSFVQNDGTIRTERPLGDRIPVQRQVIGGGPPHTPLAGGPGPSKKARAIMERVGRRKVNPKAQLLARTAEVRRLIIRRRFHSRYVDLGPDQGTQGRGIQQTHEERVDETRLSNNELNKIVGLAYILDMSNICGELVVDVTYRELAVTGRYGIPAARCFFSKRPSRKRGCRNNLGFLETVVEVQKMLSAKSRELIVHAKSAKSIKYGTCDPAWLLCTSVDNPTPEFRAQEGKNQKVSRFHRELVTLFNRELVGPSSSRLATHRSRALRMGRTALDPASKAANRRAALQRYAEKKRDDLREAARLRMQRLRAHRPEEEVADSREKARVSSQKYRERPQNSNDGGARQRSAKDVEAKNRPTPQRPKAKRLVKPQNSNDGGAQQRSAKPQRPKAKHLVKHGSTAGKDVSALDSEEQSSALASRTSITRPAPPSPLPPSSPPSLSPSPSPPPLPFPSSPWRSPEPKTTKKLKSNAGTPLNPWSSRRPRYDPNAVITPNQKRCRALRRSGLEDDNGEDSDADLPPGFCGCDSTFCQRLHKNESQNRKDWKRFHLENPDC
ncbi:hypothetical protein C8F04DRAFT_1189685 [Mycena alexandri]|uniref:Uncharacterized protein n=1 Tax=Mycena alexandri TaxID=1745969 RepID=A0AAD6WU34_9AGAR|nr:hypothetical protein C8F04DRAFT_1189685 [Mycena alexandri]